MTTATSTPPIPATGQLRVETLAQHWAWSQGLLVGIDRTRRLGNH